MTGHSHRPQPRRLAAVVVTLAVATATALLATASASPRVLDEPRSTSEAAAPARFDVLVFSRTAGFRHDSIPDGIAAVRQLGRRHGFSVTATEDPAAFTGRNLRRFEAVVWLSTTGDVLGPNQERAFTRYVRRGGGYVGVHAASDTEYEWPWYGRLVGAYFRNHPAIQPATVAVEDKNTSSSCFLPTRWDRTDEWYNYRAPESGSSDDYSPRGDVRVIASLDETSYDEGDDTESADDHPIAWLQRFQGGRSFYTGGGHTSESYAEPLFLSHLLGGIRWAAGRPADECLHVRGPRITQVRPVGSTTDRTPTVAARVGGTRRSGVRLFVDDRRRSVSWSDGRVRWTPKQALGRGPHQVRLVAEDGAGHRAVSTWRFRVRR